MPRATKIKSFALLNFTIIGRVKLNLDFGSPLERTWKRKKTKKQTELHAIADYLMLL